MKQRLGTLGWVLCLAGLPWSFFIIRLIQPFSHLDIWHANTWWMQAWMLMLAGAHSLNKRAWGQLPQACWWLVIWVSFLMLWIFQTESKSGQPYPAAMLLGLSNLWSILFALLLMASWTVEEIQTITTAIFWSGVGLICYGYLQVLNLDQFFKWIDTSKTVDTLVGGIGNPTHFGCQLALWLPFAMIQPGRKTLWVPAAVFLILLTHSSIALALAVLLVTAWMWKNSWKYGVGALSSFMLAGCWFFATHSDWINPHGRWEVWMAWGKSIIHRPILGWGLGFTKQFAQSLAPLNPLFGWKHLHNEYLQLWVETGIIGLGLMCWMLWQLWQRRKQSQSTLLRWACGWSLIACLLMALLNFPFHLWQLGGWGLMAGAGWISLTEVRMA